MFKGSANDNDVDDDPLGNFGKQKQRRHWRATMIKMMYKHKMASQITEACYMYLLTKQHKVYSLRDGRIV